MLLTEREIFIPKIDENQNLLSEISEEVLGSSGAEEIPVRFALTETTTEGYQCELGVLSENNSASLPEQKSIFEFQKRSYENTSSFNTVLLIPTGIGAELGGHSGDGGPLARLFAGSCDKLITHPNVVNAADINELPENGLYVEGSVISRLLMGTIALQEVRSNRVLLVLDEHTDKFIEELSINAASAARAGLGLDCPSVVTMKDRVILRALYSKSGRAVGRIEYLERLFKVIEDYRNDFDAVALSSLINVPERYHGDYFRRELPEMINPWGGVEAMLTHAISLAFNIPSAHSPMTPSREVLDLDVGVVDPRKSAEVVSSTYLHCILKGLQKSPKIIPTVATTSMPGLITSSDVSCLVVPDGCIGLPTLAALEQGIPIIAVRENKNCMRNNLESLPFERGKLFIVDNYLEAVGVMSALRSGVSLDTVRRPLPDTVVKKSVNSPGQSINKAKVDLLDNEMRNMNDEH